MQKSDLKIHWHCFRNEKLYERRPIVYHRVKSCKNELFACGLFFFFITVTSCMWTAKVQKMEMKLFANDNYDARPLSDDFKSKCCRWGTLSTSIDSSMSGFWFYFLFLPCSPDQCSSAHLSAILSEEKRCVAHTFCSQGWLSGWTSVKEVKICVCDWQIGQ